MIERLPDWPARLHDFVDAVKREPFAWSSLDCAQGFSSGAVLAMTDVDLAQQYRDRYASRTGAVKVMRKDGHANLADLVASHLPEIHVSEARIGDLAAIPDEGPFGFTIGVVNGERILVMREDGMGTVDLLDAKRAFRIG